jgi:hypothetical protein
MPEPPLSFAVRDKYDWQKQNNKVIGKEVEPKGEFDNFGFTFKGIF